ncbi:1-acyl-sn-glycerol-3-phosphate acyltransferase [Streptomyces sp. XM4193]|uniref:lysophospholipid acyltransferase family protein n=1 Tax=Streptomyces sp. XM4193 TaxID=2929782 RepID=UPI001FF90D8E|nr:lysophospholipid acyltransferase family protein [Streptomyces sp. XM4193]MCK1798801.1 1-acyl-sn-glycerol-3-phosphate acyltransferase [Streptomyces sp. XM4193]
MSRRRIGFWFRFAAALVKPPMNLLFKRVWRGMEHIPAEGGFIAAVNHNSYLDPLSYAHYQYNAGRMPRFLAKVSLFGKGFVGGMMRRTGQIPVYRETSSAIGAFRAAVEAIDRGQGVVFYPEGTLTRDPELWPMDGKTGAARVALRTRAPVIPVAQWGAHEVVPPYAKSKRIYLFPRRTLQVKAGPPVDLSAFYGVEPTAEVLREVTDLIMEAITLQLADVRGEPAPAKRLSVHRVEAAEQHGGEASGNGDARGAGRRREPRGDRSRGGGANSGSYGDTYGDKNSSDRSSTSEEEKA